jgi:hypothetical protein
LFLCQCLCVHMSDGSFLVHGLFCNTNTTKNDKNRHNKTNKEDKQQRREEIASNNRLTTIAQHGRGGGGVRGVMKVECGGWWGDRREWGGGRRGGKRVEKHPSTLHLIMNMYGVDEGVVEKGISFLLFLFFPTS